MTTHDIVFLFDIDNTLVDNDHVQADLSSTSPPRMARRRATAIGRSWRSCGPNSAMSIIWVRSERYRLEALHRPEILRMSNWMIDYPFADRVYPGGLDAVRHVRQWGLPVMLSDGDAVFQPRKVERSGIWNEFEGRVLIYIHKEQELDDVERLYPARHYVLIDDKLRILTTAKKDLGRPRHHRLSKAGPLRARPGSADAISARRRRFAAIGDLKKYDLKQLVKQRT